MRTPQLRRTTRSRSLRLPVLGAALAAVALALTACGSSTKPASSSGDVPGKDALDKATGVTEVSFWHGMTGTNQTALNALVSDFNASQTKVHVTASYQGTYDDTIAKYKAAVQQKSTPSIVQIYDVGTRFMVDSKQTVSVQALADKDGYSLTDLQPNIANYYSIGGKLQSMPFNSSMPLLYINKEAFVKAGLDPANPPKTLDELTAAAKALTIKDSSGKTTQYGFGAAIYGWFVEQFAAEAGNLYCDNGNGRTAPATTLNIDSGTPVTVAKWWSDLVQGGYASNTGRVTADAQAAFKSGTVAMNIESTGVLGGYVSAAKDKGFTVATAPFPKVASSDTGGPVIGGASLWIDGVGHSAAEQRGSWEFAKFASSPAEQAKWHVATGYFPVNQKALQDPVDTAYVSSHPQFQTAIDELKATSPTPATAGCLLGVMPAARADLEMGLQSSIAGTSTPQDAMTKASGDIKKLISQYNQAVKS